MRLLNNGAYINSKEVKEILHLEEQYYEFKTDGINFKRKSQKYLAEGNQRNSDISYSRSQYALDQADRVKEKLRQISNNIL